MQVDKEYVIDTLNALYSCGKQGDGCYSRIAYSKEDKMGRELFITRLHDLGIRSKVDQAGNIIARMEGENSELPSIIIGSHLDTVPDGGKYDGALGCVAGLAICQALIKSNQQLQHALEVVVYTDEEGARFGKGMFGSEAFCGILEPTNSKDTNRIEIMKEFGINIEDVYKATRKKDTVHCCLELHIEQGGSLDKSGVSLGVVSTIAGVKRFQIIIDGESNHSGSTLMIDRHDALVAAAGFIASVPNIVDIYGKDYTVATVGTIKVEPDTINVVPGKCVFSLEIRDNDDNTMSLIENKLRGKLVDFCQKNKCIHTFNEIAYHAPAPMTDWVIKSIESACDKIDYQYKVIPSGAFHDSLVTSLVFPTGMIFVPSVGGVSHSPKEYTKEEDIQIGCNALLETVLQVDKINNTNNKSI